MHRNVDDKKTRNDRANGADGKKATTVAALADMEYTDARLDIVEGPDVSCGSVEHPWKSAVIRTEKEAVENLYPETAFLGIRGVHMSESVTTLTIFMNVRVGTPAMVSSGTKGGGSAKWPTKKGYTVTVGCSRDELGCTALEPVDHEEDYSLSSGADIKDPKKHVYY